MRSIPPHLSVTILENQMRHPLWVHVSVKWAPLWLMQRSNSSNELGTGAVDSPLQPTAEKQQSRSHPSQPNKGTSTLEPMDMPQCHHSPQFSPHPLNGDVHRTSSHQRPSSTDKSQNVKLEPTTTYRCYERQY